MTFERIADRDLRGVVIDTLRVEPGATLTQVQTRLRARIGRTLENSETQRLHEIYSDEGYEAAASAVVSDKAAHMATQASLSHARPNAKEIMGLIAGIVPLFVHFQTTSVSRTGGVASSSYFDIVALVGGIMAIAAGFGAVLLLQKGPQRIFHLGVVAIVLLLGIYQCLLGFGLLHRLGIYQYS